jgi:hypothetical protein
MLARGNAIIDEVEAEMAAVVAQRHASSPPTDGSSTSRTEQAAPIGSQGLLVSNRAAASAGVTHEPPRNGFISVRRLIYLGGCRP